MTDIVQSERDDQTTGDETDPGVPSVAQKEFEDDGLGGDSRGGASRAEDPGDPDESATDPIDEGDVSETRRDDSEDDSGEPDLVVRVTDD